MENIYALPEFEPIIHQFQLGKVIKVALRPDYIKQSRLLQVDINFDDLEISDILTPMELKTILVNASDNSVILSQIFGKNVVLPHIQGQILACLYKTGGMTINQIKDALGYAPDASTHTVDTAIYQLRRTYGRDFIINNSGVYSIGKL